MLKRAAESQPEGQPAQKAPAKGAAAGMRADEVINPIPRLFKQNSITIHISQRTFEEIAPGELKWVPTSQYWAAMFDKFHMDQFYKYYSRCSTYEITNPKVRLSNLLMLQDEQKTNSGTPTDQSIFTQACYLIHYEPKGMKNWFKLGSSDNCGESQNILKYKPMKANDCKLISQLISIGEEGGKYQDFECLTINPAKPDIYAGWRPLEVEYTKEGAKVSQKYNEEMEDKAKYQVKDTFISPKDPNLGGFSCSVHGDDPYIPLMHHTTFCRNNDKISLHKYGDVLEWDVNTNMKGIQLMKHKHNEPLGGTDYIKLKKTDDDMGVPTEVIENRVIHYAFCYPSENRPFYCRRDNFDYTGPIEHNKQFGELKHHFLTMPPIKKHDGTLIKQRCSFIMEQGLSVTFHFPETVSEEDADFMDAQNKGVILRPAFINSYKVPSIPDKTPPTPTTPPEEVWDPERDKLRKELYEKNAKKEPTSEEYSQETRDTMMGKLTATLENIYTNMVEFTKFCKAIGEICPDIVASTEKPAAEGKLTIKTYPLTELEHTNMIDQTDQDTQSLVFGWAFVGFLESLVESGYRGVNYPHIDKEINFSKEDHGELMNLKISEALIRCTQDYIDGALSLSSCPHDTIFELHLTKSMNPIISWYRSKGYDEKHKLKVNLFETWMYQSHASYYPCRFPISLWIEYLNRMNIKILPKHHVIINHIRQYNECIQKQIDKNYPRIKIRKLFMNHNIDPIDIITQLKYEYVTDTFFV